METPGPLSVICGGERMGGSKDRLRGLVKLSVSLGPSPLVLEVGGSGGQVNPSVISGPGSPEVHHPWS